MILCVVVVLLLLCRTLMDESGKRPSIVSAGDSPWETQCVLASCQSLALLEGEVVGDPLEKACLAAINWSVNKGMLLHCEQCSQ